MSWYIFIWFPKRPGSRKTELPETPSRTPCIGAVLPHPPSRMAACQELLEHLPALQGELAATEPEQFEDEPTLALQLQQMERSAACRPRVVYYRQDAPAPLAGSHLSLLL